MYFSANAQTTENSYFERALFKDVKKSGEAVEETSADGEVMGPYFLTRKSNLAFLHYQPGYYQQEPQSLREGGKVNISQADLIKLKLIEEELMESEQRFRHMVDTAPMMVWMSGTDTLCNFFNQPWLDFR